MTSLVRSWIVISPLVALAGCSAAQATDTDAGTADAGPLEPCTEPGTYDIFLLTLENDCGDTGPSDTAFPIDIPPPMVVSTGCNVLEWVELEECAWRVNVRCTGDFEPMPPIEMTMTLEARGGRVEGTFLTRSTTDAGAVCTASGVLSTRDD